MTAVVAMQNNMPHEFGDQEISYSTNNEITQNNGSESQLNAKEENAAMTLESMGLQAEAEEDMVTENLNTSKTSSSKRKSGEKEKLYCETILGEVTPSQQDAIDRISTLEGLTQMKKWLEAAKSAQQHKRLGMLLAQCWKAKIDVNFLSKTNIGKLVRDFKKYPDGDVRKASSEVLKKWKHAVENDEASKAKKSGAITAVKSVASVSKPLGHASVAAKPQPSAPIIPKAEKKNLVVSRPKTARTKNTAFRKTGFEEEEEDMHAPPSKRPAPTILSQLSTPITKPTVQFPKKSSGSAVVSNSFMNALASGAVNAIELQKKRKKPPPVIDLPLTSPSDPIAVTTPTTTTSATTTVIEVDPSGPDPSRVPAPGAPKKIHFADDKGEELVLIKLIENVLHNKSHRPPSDMKHADAEEERKSLKLKNDFEVEDDDEEDMPGMRNTVKDNTWKVIPYYKQVPKNFCQELIDEEEARYANVMRTFVPDAKIPIEHPSEPDDVEYAYTKIREPENIPADFVMGEEEPDQEQEVMDVDAPASPDTSHAPVSPSELPDVSSVPAPQPTVSTSMPVNFQILNDVDVHGAGKIRPPKPIPFPLNPPFYSVPPPPISHPPSVPPPTFSQPPQPVPPPSQELIILDDQPSKLNAPRLSNSAPDASSMLQKLLGKKSLDEILGKVKGSKAQNAVPSSSATAAASAIPQHFNVPPPSIPVRSIPSPEIQILNNIDIHASQSFSAAPRPPGPGMPMMPGARQQPRPPPGSSGKVCTFFLQGKCTFGNNCFNEHRQPQQKQMGYRAPGPQYNSNTRGGGSLRGRFNPAANKTSLNSSNQNSNSEVTKDQDSFYRSRKGRDDFRGSRRRSPPSRRSRRRSRSDSEEEERYRSRRRRSRSPRSRSSSPEERRRRTPPSRSASRSPLPSRSPSPNRS